jgi:hypothetical protein
MAPTSRTASLRLQLIDAVSGPSKGVASSLKSMDSILSKFGKNGTTEMKRLVKQLEYLKQKSGAIDKFSGSRRGLKDVTQALEQARSEVGRLERAITSTSKPTKKMQQDLDRARTAVKNASQAFGQQNTAVREAEGALRKYSVDSGRNIESAQRRIRESIAKTIVDMRKLDRVQREEANKPRPQRPLRNPNPSLRPPADRHRGPSILGTATDAVTFYGGMKATEGFRGMVSGAAEIEAARNRIRNVANNEQEVALASQLAAEASGKYPLTSQAASLHDYGELRSLAVSKDPGKAIDTDRMRKNVLLMAQARAALASSNYDLDEGEAKALAQAIEGSGRAMDPNAQMKIMDAFVRGKQVFGNALQATDLRDFVQNAKSSNFSTSDESFFNTIVARLAQGNSSRLGNEFAQTMNTLVGGHMTKQGANWLADVGMINKNQIKKGGGGKFYITGGVKEADLLSTDQTAWAQTVLMPGLQKAGYLDHHLVQKRVDVLRKSSPNADPGTLEERAIHGLVADALSKSGFRSTVTDNLAHAIANQFQTDKDVEQLKAAKGLGAANTVGQNPIAAMNELTTSLSNFGAVLTNPVMKDAAGIMHDMAGGISDMTASLRGWQKDHPTASKVAGTAAPGLLGALGGYLTWHGIKSLGRGIFGRGAGGAVAEGTAAGAGGSGLASILLTAARVLGPAAGYATAGYGVGKFLQGTGTIASGKYYTPQDQGAAADMKQQRDEIAAQIAAIKANSKIPDMADILVRPLQDKLDQLDLRLKSFDTLQVKPQVDASSIDAAITKANTLRAALSGVGVSGPGKAVGTPANTNKFGGPRARGGGVSVGRTYLVGEEGPELFNPGASGSITPNHAIGGPTVVNHIAIHLHGKASRDDANEILQKLDQALHRSSQTAFGGLKPYGD